MIDTSKCLETQMAERFNKPRIHKSRRYHWWIVTLPGGFHDFHGTWQGALAMVKRWYKRNKGEPKQHA